MRRDLLSTLEVARMLQVNQATVTNKVTRGTLPYADLTAQGGYRITRRAVTQYLRRKGHRGPGATPCPAA